MQSKRKLANEQTTEGVYERYFLGLWLLDEQPEKQLEREINRSKPCLSVLKNSVNSTRNSYKVMFFWNSRAFTKSSFISKVDELYTKSLSQRQIPNSQGPLGGVIFLAIFSDINAVDAKAMRKASNELYFLPLILAKCMEGKKWIVFDKTFSFKPELPAHERSLNVKSFTQHILWQSINATQTTRKMALEKPTKLILCFHSVDLYIIRQSPETN